MRTELVLLVLTMADYSRVEFIFNLDDIFFSITDTRCVSEFDGHATLMIMLRSDGHDRSAEIHTAKTTLRYWENIM